ncbi:HAD-superfamily hydrolase, subfamily IA, variant 3 [Rippkaea orientalis PCC 8801]|uniref:HAD-superfamily hydrolase, subfamily IA, variant 3 n=1 Tax=Rippkaea orientalis (strain PCC 8801 / RF-1) TaxID=41431 RepID=B7JYW0_RIPO1|nr:HAD-IA family hydrolase [Rippkaea orientalis]ACK66037.1 HAD-superfamily hydrolase, subfamily IA, variant 3 [Rippkaea orientalis PCC 8801]
MSNLKALIFDVDGTLAQTERDGHRVAFNLAFAEAGLEWYWSESLYGELLAVAGGKERIRFYLQQYHRDFTEDLDHLIPRLHQAKTEHYRQLLSSGKITLRLGVKRLIEEAYQEGIRLAIATTSALPNALALLEKNLDQTWFEVIAAGDIVPAKKPAPDIYHYVLDQMNLAAENCLVFEDSCHGLMAATQAGLKTVVTVNDYTINQDFSRATLVINHLGEPEEPFKIIQGEVSNKHYLDLNLAKELLS